MLATKNPFAKSPPVTQPTPSVLAAEDLLKGRQLLRGRTRAKVDALKAQVEDARKSRADAKQTLGERMGDGEDVTSITRTVREAHDRLDALEAALAVAIQKDESALADLREAERQEKIEKEVAAVAHLKRVLLKVDQLFLDLEPLTVDEVSPALNAARLLLTASGMRDGELNFLSKVPLEFKRHLLCAVHTLIGEGFVPVNMNAYERLSQLIPDEDFIRSRARPGPSTERPIHGWQIGE